MNKIVIIADDLTGANATGVLLARDGYRTGTFLSLDQITEEQFHTYDVISINTESRGIPQEEAFDRVTKVVQTMAQRPIDMFSKRIDSTLRGNVGAEIDAILDQLGPDYIAIVVPAYPSSGRVTVGDFLMVESIPLEKTFAAKDPKTPVDVSRVSEIVAKQTKHEIANVCLDIVLKSPKAISKAILQQKEAGKRIIIFDAATDENLDQIAEGVKISGIKAVAVDPGPFTAAMASRILDQPERQLGRKVLLVVGSVTPVARQQLMVVESHYHSRLTYVDAESLIDDTKAEGEKNKVIHSVLENMSEYQVLGIRTIKNDGDILNIEEIAQKMDQQVDAVAMKISNALAQITKEILEKSMGVIGALYTSGGDTTVAICKELEAVGVQVKDEVIPLAVYGRMIGGKHENLPLITKGGLVGDEDAISMCIDYLLTKVSNEYSPLMETNHVRI